MNVKEEVVEEYKTKLKNKLLDLKNVLERKTRTLETQIDDLENGIDVDFYYKLIEHINNAIVIQGQKTQEYLILMLKQIKALDTEDKQSNSNSEPKEHIKKEGKKKETNSNIIDEIDEDL